MTEHQVGRLDSHLFEQSALCPERCGVLRQSVVRPNVCQMVTIIIESKFGTIIGLRGSHRVVAGW